MGDKKFLAGHTPMMVLKLLERREMYGWEILDEFAEQSFDTFTLKGGALYPILHNFEKNGYVVSNSRTIENGRVRKYYSITNHGKEYLMKKQTEWEIYSRAVNNIMKGDSGYAIT